MLYRTKNENVEVAKCPKHGNAVHRRYSRKQATWSDQLQCSQCRNEYEGRRVRQGSYISEGDRIQFGIQM